MIEKIDFWFSPAHQNRRLHIYLPNDYFNSNERYPVMYMFDGHNLFYDSDATYGKSWGFNGRPEDCRIKGTNRLTLRMAGLFVLP